jgi:predicted metal-dependent HD superfamily phosphohydrolase
VCQREASLDRARWAGLWARLGARNSGIIPFEKLQTAYREPTRFYHTAAHIIDCLGVFGRHRDLARYPDSVEAAIWFHDAVYVPGAPDNEERSAGLAGAELTNGAVPAEIVRQVGRLVLATDHRTNPEDPDAQLLCDIDLSILGRDVAEYDQYEQRIRREYAGITEALYRRGRSVFLEAFLARPYIYATERFRSEYERRARANLARSLSRLAEPT